jgi:iron transport multicopper oxidase
MRNCRFETRGIVALVFSCVSGIIGMAVVAWYGFAGGVGEGSQEKSAGHEGKRQVGEVGNSEENQGRESDSAVVGAGAEMGGDGDGGRGRR